MTQSLFSQFTALMRDHSDDLTSHRFDVDYYIYDEHLGEFSVPVRITVTDPETFLDWLGTQADNNQITSPVENYMIDTLDIHPFDDLRDPGKQLSPSNLYETLAQIMALAEEYEAPAITCVINI